MAWDDVSIVIDSEDMDRASVFVETFGKKAEVGLRQAINRALAGVKTDAAREVREEYTVKAGDVKKSFRISKAGRLMVGKAVSSGYRIPLIKFGSSPKKPRYPHKFPSVTGKKVSVRVKRDRKALQKEGDRYPFVAMMPSGHIMIARRVFDARLSISELYGPSVPSMIASDNNRIKDELQKGAEVRFNKNLDHAINRAFQQAGIQ